MPIDYQIPMSVRAPNLGDLLPAYMQGANFRRQGEEAAQLARQREQEMLLRQGQEQRAQFGEQRAQAQEGRSVAEEGRTATKFRQSTRKEDIELRELEDAADDQRRFRLAKRLRSLTDEEKKPYLMDFVEEYDLDPKIIPDGPVTKEYETELLKSTLNGKEYLAYEAEQQNAMLPPEYKASDFEIKQDFNTGKMVRVNKLANTYDPVGKGQAPISQPPRAFMAQGTEGAYLVTPRPGGQASAAPIGIKADGQAEQLRNLKDPTAGVKEGVVEAKRQHDTLDTLIKELAADPDYSPSSVAKGFAYEKLLGGRQIVDALDHKGIRSRTLIGKITSAAIKETSGAAVTAAEWPRLTPWVPRFTDTKAQLLQKLKSLKAGTEKSLKLTNQQYSPAQGYRSDPILEEMFAPKAAPAAAPSDFQVGSPTTAGKPKSGATKTGKKYTIR